MRTTKRQRLVAILIMASALIAGVVASSSAYAGEISHGLAGRHAVSGPSA